MSQQDNGRFGVVVALGFFWLAGLTIAALRERPQPACFCEPAKQGPQGERGEQGIPGPAGPQGEPGESCECDLEHVATKLELATVAIESRTAIIALRQQVAELKQCCCQPTPAKQPPEVLPTPKPQPQSRVKRRCPRCG